MEEKKYYSIGEVSKIFGVSTRTLRYYDKIQLICPSKRSEGSEYRYYTDEDIVRLTVLMYYKNHYGFALEDIRAFLEQNSIDRLICVFRNNEFRLEKELIEVERRLDDLRAWRVLLEEGKIHLSSKKPLVSVRYVPKIFTLSGYKFTGDSGNCHRHTDIMGDRSQDCPFRVKEEQTGQVTYGAEYCEYASAKKRMEYISQPAYFHMEIHPKTFNGIGCSRLGGYQAVTALHLGNVDNINETYKKAFDWAEKHGFSLVGNSIERYVVDILSIFDYDQHVTEILLPIEEEEMEDEK